MADPEFLDIAGKKVAASDVVVCPITGSLLLAPASARNYPDLHRMVAVTKRVRDDLDPSQSYEVFVHSRSAVTLVR